MQKYKCNSNYCDHNRKNSADDFLDVKNGITINNDRSRSASPEYQRSRSQSPDYLKTVKCVRSRSQSPKYQRSRSCSPKRKKYNKRACKHIMFKTAKALCNPKLRKKYAKVIAQKKKRKRKNKALSKKS